MLMYWKINFGVSVFKADKQLMLYFSSYSHLIPLATQAEGINPENTWAGNDFRLVAGGCSRTHFHPRNNNVGQRWKTQSLPKHRKLLPHTPNTAQTTPPPRRRENYTRNGDCAARAIICLHAGNCIIVCGRHDRRDVCSLDSCLGKKQTDLEQTQFPPSSPDAPHPPPLLVSALLGSPMTAEWSPHYWEELACNFTTHFLSMPLNNKCRASLCGQLSAAALV